MGVRAPDLFPVDLSRIMAWQNPSSEISAKGEIMADESVICPHMSLHIEPKLFRVRPRDCLPGAARSVEHKHNYAYLNNHSPNSLSYPVLGELLVYGTIPGVRAFLS